MYRTFTYFVIYIKNDIILIFYIKYKPNEWNYIKSYKNIIRSLRDLARKQILNRLELIKDGAYFSKDILTYLLKSIIKFAIFTMLKIFDERVK
jgi:hypothetical protein